MQILLVLYLYMYKWMRQQKLDTENNIRQSSIDLCNLQSIQYDIGTESAELWWMREKVYNTIWPRL